MINAVEGEWIFMCLLKGCSRNQKLQAQLDVQKATYSYLYGEFDVLMRHANGRSHNEDVS